MSFSLGRNKEISPDKSRYGGNLDELFSDGLNSPELEKLLVNCLRSKESFLLSTKRQRNPEVK